MKKGVEKTDLYQLHLLSGLKASPSGNRLVYVHTQMAEASDTYEKNLWLLEGKRNFCIYQKQKFSAFLWENEHTLLIQKPAKEQKTEEIRVTVNEKGKNLFIYQNPVNRVSDFIGEFNSVMFCPDDMNLFQASPRVRRRFVDMELSKISKKYVSTLYVATRLLKERNAYLKQERVDRSYLEVLTSQLVDASVVIMKQRHFFLEELLDKCRTFYRQLSNDDTDITVRYLSCVPFSDSEEALKEALLRKYQKHQDRDLLLKQTTAGIHKEDFIFEMNGHELVSFASQGQKRSVLLALKIGMIHMIHEIIQEYPVLLLDDVFSELDSYRKQELLKSLPKEVQIFISTTDFVEMDDMKSDRRVTLWNVSNGTIERC